MYETTQSSHENVFFCFGFFFSVCFSVGCLVESECCRNGDDPATAVHLGGDDFQFHGSNPVESKLKIGPELLVLIS